MIEKVMIFDGVAYLDVEWIAAVYEAPDDNDGTKNRAVRLKSGQVHTSPGTVDELMELIEVATTQPDDTLVEIPDPPKQPRWLPPGVTVGD